MFFMVVVIQDKSIDHCFFSFFTRLRPIGNFCLKQKVKNIMHLCFKSLSIRVGRVTENKQLSLSLSLPGMTSAFEKWILGRSSFKNTYFKIITCVQHLSYSWKFSLIGVTDKDKSKTKQTNRKQNKTCESVWRLSIPFYQSTVACFCHFAVL